MSNQHPDEMPSELQREIMALLMDNMICLGATWPMIRQELLRMTLLEKPPFDYVPSQSTLERIVLEYFGHPTMTEFREKRKESVSFQLKSKAVNMALAGNVSILIFCLKNLAGWSDNVKFVDENAKKKKTWKLAYDKDDLKDDSETGDS